MFKTRNVNFTPYFSNDLNKHQKNLEKDVEEFFKGSKEHKIYCVSNVYGCRLGVFGLSALLLSKYIEEHTTYKTLSKVVKNLSYFTSILNRMIPVLNYGVYDIKDVNIDNVHFNANLSITSMFDFNNLCMTNYYDSGCVIYSNVSSHANGFISLITFGKVNSNSGITWSYFDTGVLVMIVEMLDPQYVPNMTIVRFVNNMKNQYKNLHTTYVYIEDTSGLSIEELNTLEHKVTIISPKLNDVEIEHVLDVDVVESKIVLIDEYFVSKDKDIQNITVSEDIQNITVSVDENNENDRNDRNDGYTIL